MSESLCVLAGDLSGDRAASLALTHLTSQHPTLSLFGLGGHNLAALGQEQFADLSSLAVLGFAEVFAKFGFFRDLLHRCENEIRRRKPRAVILVDYPGFNVRLLRKIADLNIPIIYLIPPQLWAWGAWRVKHLHACKKLLVMLPFEENFYRGHALPVSFVKHYLLDEIPESQILSQRPPNGPILLLPGSRPGEIARHLPVLLNAAKQIREQANSKTGSEISFTVGALTGVANYAGMVGESGVDVRVAYDQTRSLIVESSFVLAASGTVALECALLGRATMVMFKTGWFNYQLAKRLVVVKHISLPNLIADKTIFPEFIQQRATSELLAAQALKWLSEPRELSRIESELASLVQRFGGAGFGLRAAQELEGLLYA